MPTAGSLASQRRQAYHVACPEDSPAAQDSVCLPTYLDVAREGPLLVIRQAEVEHTAGGIWDRRLNPYRPTSTERRLLVNPSRRG